MSDDTGAQPMEVDPASTPVLATSIVEDEEACNDLVELFESAEEVTDKKSAIPILSSILLEPQNRYGSTAVSIKERAVYALARAYCSTGDFDEVVNLLTGATCSGFFVNVTKAKCAKVVRGVLDAVCALSPDQLDMVSLAAVFNRFRFK